MDNSNDFQEDLPEPIKKSGLSTPAREAHQNAVQSTKNHNKLSPPPFKKTPKTSAYPTLQSLEQKTVISEEVRIKGQQKLTYLKQCRHKKYTNEQIFENYPFSSMQIFTFDDMKLRDANGNLQASIVEDEKGLHLVQQYHQTSNSRYITAQEQEQRNQFNGLSVSLFSNGNIFQGMYHNGKCCGLGYELQSNGNTYIGSFKDGVKNGNGTFYWFVNNQMYIGEWHGGLPHGTGAYIGKDRYEGNFLNGLKFGFGEQTFSNGDKYVGEYVNSVADGYGEYYWADASIYKGDFKQGVRHGYGIWKDDTEVYKGNYRLDKKEGFGIYIWKSKQVYKGEFKDDFRQGYGEFFSIVNGSEKNVYRGCWVRGKKNEEGKVDENVVKMLHIFLQRSQQFDSEIEQNSKKDKQKKRVGHRNCIPKESLPCTHKH